MRTTVLACGLLTALASLLACSHALTPAAGGGAGSAPVSVFFLDSPPGGITVLSFEVSVTGALLQPGNVSLLSTPQTIELTQLLTEKSFLSTTRVPPNTYSSMTLTFAAVKLTFLNNTGTTFAGCANSAVCEVTPATTPASVNITGTPFPLTVTANTPVGLVVDAVLSNIIQPDLSVNLAAPNGINLSQLPATPLSSQLAKFDDVVGQVTSLGTNQFTVNTAGGLTLPVNVGSKTTFSYPASSCSANNFTCVLTSQIVELELLLLGDGSFTAAQVALEDTVGSKEVTGIIVSVGSGTPPTQFQMVIHGQVPTLTGVTTGSTATVTLQSAAKFAVDANGLPVSAGLSFAGASDLLLGQEVLVQVGTLTTTPAITISTGRVLLRMSQFTATVGTVNSANQTFTVGSLPSLFSAASPTPITQIQVQTSAATQFQNVTVLASGNTVSVKGLLFNTIGSVGSPTMAAEKVRGRTPTGL